ncbi:MAG: DUF423 domain-containing protein [Fibrobacteres bacterium]|jgi:uncharacterized membrane protein YgdD (TMEM256/DUF423 family)|nr:DUF423 domain-containing protein [Fibrobacterota bacterium]
MLWIRIAAALGFLGVALGAFGAHALKSRLSADMLEVWHTGVLYHLIHALALLALALYARAAASPAPITAPAIGFVVGIILFSGSLYALALTGFRPLGAITPFGGLSFLFAWGWIAVKGL